MQPRKKGRHAAVGTLERLRLEIVGNSGTDVHSNLLIPNDRIPPPRPPADSLVAPPSAVPRPRTDKGYPANRRRTPVSRLALLTILILQAVMSLRLRNTAFEDEALYLYAGRMELAHLLHGAALQGDYASYFSGAPVLYPVLGAALNAVGGLALARALSLAEMLAVTVMLYSISRFLFSERAALCAAALFSVTESVIFLGHLATFDATCLFLLACATTIVVRWSARGWPVLLLAAPLAALAVAVEYAGALYVPTIAVLTAVTGWPSRGRRALLYPPAFAAVVAGLLYGALRLGGSPYAAAISSTVTNRARDGVPALAILRESGAWGGVLAVLAVAGAVAYTVRPRTGPGKRAAPPGDRRRRAALGAVLAGTAFLAPVCQMCLHTDTSLLKHVGFGLFFAAPLAGVALVRLVGDHFRSPEVGIALWCGALVLGATQSWTLYHAWPSSGPLVQTLSAYLRPGARYLVEVPEVPIYYLQGRPGAQPDQFWSTFSISYTGSHGQTLTGNAGFAAAVQAGFFSVVAYSGDVTPAADAVIARALKSSPLYQLAAVLRLSDSSGPVSYYIWVNVLSSRTQPGTYARTMGAKAKEGRPARVEDVHDLAAAMPHVTRVHGPGGNAVYQVGGKSFVFFRTPRPDATDPVTGERYADVIMFWVPSDADKRALADDPDSPFFTTAHFDGHPSVLIRAARLGELGHAELAEVVQDAWLSRASARRAAAWLDSRGLR